MRKSRRPKRRQPNRLLRASLTRDTSSLFGGGKAVAAALLLHQSLGLIRQIVARMHLQVVPCPGEFGSLPLDASSFPFSLPRLKRTPNTDPDLVFISLTSSPQPLWTLEHLHRLRTVRRPESDRFHPPVRQLGLLSTRHYHHHLLIPEVEMVRDAVWRRSEFL